MIIQYFFSPLTFELQFDEILMFFNYFLLFISFFSFLSGVSIFIMKIWNKSLKEKDLPFHILVFNF